MDTNGITVLERNFMESLMCNSKRIAIALEKANELKEAEINSKTNDTHKEKLVELIAEFTENISAKDLHKSSFDEEFADYLLSHGVVVSG